MKKNISSPDLFNQPLTDQEKQAYINGWNDAIHFLARQFDQFPFPLSGSDLLKAKINKANE